MFEDVTLTHTETFLLVLFLFGCALYLVITRTIYAEDRKIEKRKKEREKSRTDFLRKGE